MPSSRRAPAFRLYLITDRGVVRSGDLVGACAAALEAARDAAPSGTVALQLREKDLTARELYSLALKLRDVCKRNEALLLVNDRVDIALAAGADGVHLPGASIGVAMVRRLLADNQLIGVSTHSPPDVAGAAAEGADFVVFGPVFEPISKGTYGRPWGADGLAAACRAATIPVYALGGITPERASSLLRAAQADARPVGVAAIGSILGAESPARAMKEMLAALTDPR